jgi:hypothetical protein
MMADDFTPDITSVVEERILEKVRRISKQGEGRGCPKSFSEAEFHNLRYNYGSTFQ